jgi:protein-S-isoprenylcysteine O-methyltransferase Ste14
MVIGLTVISSQHKDGNMGEGDRFWYKMRGILVAPVYLLSIFCTYWEIEHWSIKTLGLVIFLVGLFMRIWSQMHLRYRLKESKILTSTGPYAYVRNPIYIGNSLILTGTTIFSELVWLTPIMIATCLIAYSLVVRYEEMHLMKKYGTPYIEYLQGVPRWIPRFPLKSSTDERMQWEYLLPSIKAEAHILLLLILPLIKEMIMGKTHL